jgi:hypothetical protein
MIYIKKDNFFSFLKIIDKFIKDKNLKKDIYIKIDCKTSDLKNNLNLLLKDFKIDNEMNINILQSGYEPKNDISFLNDYYIEIFGYDLNQLFLDATKDTIPFIYKIYTNDLTLDILKEGIKQILIFKEKPNMSESYILENDKKETSHILDTVLLEYGFTQEELNNLI